MFTFAERKRVTWRALVLLACACAFAVPCALAQPPAPLRTAPNALLTIDQNRTTVVDRIVAEWGEALAQSRAGLSSEQLRALLMGLRADHLLAANLAGDLDGLRNVLANAVTSTVDVKASLLQAKALGDAADDLVYTPVVPCRIVDTRNVGGPFAGGGETRNYHAFLTSGTFATQGGAASNCGIPANPAAAALNITTIGGSSFLTVWPFNTTQPTASTLNPAPGQIFANGALVPTCQPSCAAEFSVFTFGADLVIDIVGYFAAPVATPVDCTTAVFPLGATTTGDVPAGTAAIFTAACPTGHTITGGGCAYFTTAQVAPLATENKVLMNRSQRVFDQVTQQFINSWVCHWTNTDTITWRVQTRAVCCRVPGR